MTTSRRHLFSNTIYTIGLFYHQNRETYTTYKDWLVNNIMMIWLYSIVQHDKTDKMISLDGTIFRSNL